MLRESLKESYQYYMQEGWCSLEHKDEVEQTYQIYHKLGGNGRGTTLRDDIMRLPSYPPAANNDQQNNQ